MIDFETFRRAVAEAGEVPLDSVVSEARLAEDLGFDSLRMLVLMAALADLDVAEPEDVTVEALTVAEAFEVATRVRGDDEEALIG